MKTSGIYLLLGISTIWLFLNTFDLAQASKESSKEHTKPPKPPKPSHKSSEGHIKPPKPPKQPKPLKNLPDLLIIGTINIKCIKKKAKQLFLN